MFKAPIHKTGEDHILLRHSSRVNRLAAVSIAHGHKMELVPCVDVRVGNNNSNYTHFNWNKFLRDAYLALNRLPDDDVEAHHIKGMLTKAVEMFNGTTPFEGMEYSVTMKIVSKLEDWEADALSGNTTGGKQLAESTTAVFEEPNSSPRLKFRLDISREIGLVPMQELHRALAALPFDIELTTPLSRATLFNVPVYIASSHIETLSPEGVMDFNRFRLSLTFTTDLGDTGRELVKERMLERKVSGSMIWDDNTLVLATTCGKDDTLTDASRWRNLVEREVEEVLASLTTEHKYDRFIR